MNVTNFNRLRVNKENFVDIQSFDGHVEYGVMIIAHDFSSRRMEIRRKEKQTAMFVFQYSDLEIPEWWQDAEVLFSRLAENE